MSEEELRAIRITLSEEAFSCLDKIMKESSFRNYSSAIEECIRATYDVTDEITELVGKRGDPPVEVSDADCTGSLMRILMIMYRFSGRRPAARKNE